MTHSPSVELTSVAERLGQEITEIFAAAERLEAAVLRLISERPDGLDIPAMTSLDAAITRELERHPHFTACGFVANIGTVAGTQRYWRWLVPDRAGKSTPRPLHLQSGPNEDDENTYRYETMDWFTTPASGQVAAVGPYVDFAGVGRLVVTFTRPVMADGRFVGVTGADVSLARFEERLVKHLRAATRPVAVVNASGRVVVSSSADAVSAERPRHEPLKTLPIGGPAIGWSLYELTER